MMQVVLLSAVLRSALGSGDSACSSPLEGPHAAVGDVLLQTSRFAEPAIKNVEIEEIEITTEAPKASVSPGKDMPLNQHGYESVYNARCDAEMEIFVRRLIDDMGLEICQEGGLMGLLPWFSYDPPAAGNGASLLARSGYSQDFEGLRQAIRDNMPPANCAFVAKRGECPTILPGECGTFTKGAWPRDCGATGTTARPMIIGTKAPVTVKAIAPSPTTVAPTTAKPMIIGTKAPVTVKAVAPSKTTPTTTTTTTTTTTNECQGDVVLFFKNSTVPQSNIGGLGPDKDRSEDMVVAGLGSHRGKVFDMKITSTSDRYSSAWATYNSVYGNFGYVTMNSGKNGSSMDLKFQIVETGTSKPMVLPKFYFTFFDIDQSEPMSGFAEGGAEQVGVSGYTEYYVTAKTQLETKKNSNGQTSFRATEEGDSADNPTNPMRLSVLQQNKAVTFQFLDTSEFDVTCEVSGNARSRGREVYFAGKSNLATNPCDEQEEGAVKNTITVKR